MDFLGVGVAELIVILILALIFVGPRDLPRIAGKLGKYVRDLRMMSEGLRSEWRRELAAAGQEDLLELKDELMSVKEAIQDAGQEVRTIGQDVQKDVKEVGATVQNEVNEAHEDMKTASADINTEVQATASSIKTVGASTAKTKQQTPATVSNGTIDGESSVVKSIPDKSASPPTTNSLTNGVSDKSEAAETKVNSEAIDAS